MWACRPLLTAFTVRDCRPSNSGTWPSEILLVFRTPSKTSAKNAFRYCLTDYHMWPIFLLGLSWMLPTVPMNQYITLILKDAGYGTFQTNLLTIPAYVLFIINLLIVTWVSEKINERFLLATISQWWSMIMFIALECLPGDRSPWATWILCVLVYAQPYVHALIVAITSRNAGTVRTRTVASALYNMCVQASNIIGSNVSTLCLHVPGWRSLMNPDLPGCR